jgi:hypothetical protein
VSAHFSIDIKGALFMPSSRTTILAAGACLFGGLLAGVTANRALVEIPAWERIGLVPWATFTRAENYGIGSFFYIVLGLLAILSTILTAIVFRLDRPARSWRSFPIYAAALLAVVYALITRIVLVPTMFRLRAAGNDSVALQQIFSVAARWWRVNDILHVLAFALSIWAFAEILARPKGSSGKRFVSSGRSTVERHGPE